MSTLLRIAELAQEHVNGKSTAREFRSRLVAAISQLTSDQATKCVAECLTAEGSDKLNDLAELCFESPTCAGSWWVNENKVVFTYHINANELRHENRHMATITLPVPNSGDPATFEIMLKAVDKE